ncbi:MAG: efflux transporter periplasmic adaptor subunit [Bradyrhizobiaceae bacterium PARB1]|jgi:RND family efflux transporter MFP subunit|nr:MAG: efflux transporter periplasmic adaptor subunit [Bradyrhizobiaceae bacterium PARB1]
MRHSASVIAILLAFVGSAHAQSSFDCVIDPSETLKLGSPITGILAEVLVKRGDIVKRGQPVAVLESSVEAATVRLNQARADSTARIDAQTERLKLAQARLDRNAQLFERKIVSQDKYEELRAEARVAEQDLLREKQEQQLARLELERSDSILKQRTILATIDGVVSEKKLSAGEFISQEGYVMTLARLDPLNVEVYLPVAYFNQIRVGMVANISPAAPITETYPATVTVVDRVFDPASGTFGVRLSLPNPDNQLPGGQRCKVAFPLETAQGR